MSNNKTKTHKAQGKQKANGGDNIVVRILRWTYQSILLVATVFLLLLLVASAFSDRIDPCDFHYISFLGIGFHLILAAVLCWVLVLIVLRRWVLTLLTLCVLILINERITRYCPLNILGKDAQTSIADTNGIKHEIGNIDTLSILTYNTCALGQVHLSKIKEKIPVLDVIRNSHADIVCMQEYAFTLSKNGHTQEQIRKSLADLYPYYDYMPNTGRKAMGIALYSKYPIKRALRIDKRSKGYVSSMYYELMVKERRIALVNNHLKSNMIEKRDRMLYGEMVEHFEPDSIERIRTGMLRSLGKGYKARAAQAKMIKTFVNEQVGDSDMPVIICGDFNDTPVSYCYRTMRGDLHDAWQDAGLGTGTTYNQHHLWFRIDYVLHSSHFKTLSAKVLDQYTYSDHYPMLTKIQLLPCN